MGGPPTMHAGSSLGAPKRLGSHAVAHVWSARHMLFAVMLWSCTYLGAVVQAVPIDPSEVTVLQSLQTAWGTTYSGWTSTSDCSAAAKIACDGSGRIICMNLGGNQLSGSIPASLGSLTNLVWLNFGENQLTGSIPASIGNLKNLLWLSLGTNKLSGSIPESFSALQKISELYLDTNQLSGTIPAFFSAMRSLRNLFLFWNQLTGEIPSSIGTLAQLNDLRLSNNKLTGNIPQSIGALTGLTCLHLFYNQLTGSIPPSIGSLTNARIIDIGGNRLTGSIPASLGALSSVQKILFAGNQLEGNIPDIFSGLRELMTLHLHYNQLTGIIPPSVGYLTNAVDIRLDNNKLTGNVPTSIGALGGLTQLKLPPTVACPSSDTACPGLPPPERRGVFCKTTCVNFCSNCIQAQSPPWTTPPLRRPSPPLRRSPPRSRTPQKSPPSLPRAPPPLPQPKRSGSQPPQTPQRPAAARAPPRKLLTPPPPAQSVPSGQTFGLLPNMLIVPRFQNGITFRYASLNYTYSRSNWKIDSSTDWTTEDNAIGQAVVPSVKDQGPCGACWAMASVSAVSAASAIVFDTPGDGTSVPDLSVQQVISCSSRQGCDGGLPSVAFDYMVNWTRSGQSLERTQGLFSETNYKYTNNNATCKLPPCTTCKPSRFGVTTYEQADFYGWFGLLLTLQQQPAVVMLYAACINFRAYTGGIFSQEDGKDCESVPNHAVLAVGYTLNAGLPYWVLQNSWGLRWGTRGQMKMAITGGFGLCNIHLAPAMYPVITSSDPCSSHISVCGSGVCNLVRPYSYKCICQDPFTSILNIDGITESCVPKAICSFFLFNPCSVGTCIDDGKGGYSCICPTDFVPGERSTDGAKTCVPRNTLAQRVFKVDIEGLTCTLLAATYGLTVDQLIQQNNEQAYVCDLESIPLGTELNVTRPGNVPPCSVVYTWSKSDTCMNVAKHFGLTRGYEDLESLNPWLQCNFAPAVSPGMQICVRRSDAALSLPNCTWYYTAQEDDTCKTIWDRNGLNATTFYMLNPGIYCDNLQRAKSGAFSGQQVCIAASTTAFTQCVAGSSPRTLVSGDNCLNLLAQFFRTRARMAKLNNGLQCSKQSLVVGKTICVPDSALQRAPPPKLKKAKLSP